MVGIRCGGLIIDGVIEVVNVWAFRDNDVEQGGKRSAKRDGRTNIQAKKGVFNT